MACPASARFPCTPVAREGPMTSTMLRPGEAKLAALFRPGQLGKLATRNLIKYGACCVSNYNTRDGFITPRELARRDEAVAGVVIGYAARAVLDQIARGELAQLPGPEQGGKLGFTGAQHGRRHRSLSSDRRAREAGRRRARHGRGGVPLRR